MVTHSNAGETSKPRLHAVRTSKRFSRTVRTREPSLPPARRHEGTRVSFNTTTHSGCNNDSAPVLKKTTKVGESEVQKKPMEVEPLPTSSMCAASPAPVSRASFVQRLEIPNAHTAAITNVKFCPLGRVLASCSADRLVKLWDGTSGAPLATLEGHMQGVSDAAWDPDGIFLATASDDSTIRLWDVATVRLVLDENPLLVFAPLISPLSLLLLFFLIKKSALPFPAPPHPPSPPKLCICVPGSPCVQAPARARQLCYLPSL